MITIKSTQYTKFDVDFCTDVLLNGLSYSCPAFGNEKVYGANYCNSCSHKLACTELKSAYHYMLSKKVAVRSSLPI